MKLVTLGSNSGADNGLIPIDQVPERGNPIGLRKGLVQVAAGLYLHQINSDGSESLYPFPSPPSGTSVLGSSSSSLTWLDTEEC